MPLAFVEMVHSSGFMAKFASCLGSLHSGGQSKLFLWRFSGSSNGFVVLLHTAPGRPSF